MTEQKQPQAGSPEWLRDNLAYDRQSGVLVWRHINNQYSGRAAGTRKSKHGKTYIRLYVRRKSFAAHVVAWYIETGRWIPGGIDHINGDGTDNRIENLREADSFENMKNKRRMKNNTSGVCGVIWHKRDHIWEARLNVRGKRITLGRYATKEEAIRSREQASAQYGFHPNHGKDRPL